MSLNRIAAYTEVVTHGNDQPATGPVTAAQADGIVASAVRRGYAIEPTKQGVLVVRRPSARIVVELRPLFRPALTQLQVRDLAMLARHGGCLRMRQGALTITAGLAGIPPAATRRLLDCGWVSCLHLNDAQPVSVSVAGRVALALRVSALRDAVTDAIHAAWVAGRDELEYQASAEYATDRAQGGAFEFTVDGALYP